MAIDFEFYENPDASGDKAGKYHPRVVTSRTVSSNEIAQNVQLATSLTISDVKAVLSALSEEISVHLGESRRVHLEGIGYFQLTLKCDKEITDPRKARAQNVSLKSVRFRADEELKKKLRTAGITRAGIKNHSASLTNEEIDRRLAKFFEKIDFLTRVHFQKLCGMTPSTAARHIKRLEEEGKIKNINTRHQPVYVPVTEDSFRR